MLPHGCDTVPLIYICLKLPEIFFLHTCTASASDTGVTRELSVGTSGLNLGGGGLDTRVTIPSILSTIVAVMGIAVSAITAVCLHHHKKRKSKGQGNTFHHNEAHYCYYLYLSLTLLEH